MRLVLHMGTARAEDRKAPPVLDDPAGLVAWSSDIRGLLTFADLPDLEARREASWTCCAAGSPCPSDPEVGGPGRRAGRRDPRTGGASFRAPVWSSQRGRAYGPRVFVGG